MKPESSVVFVSYLWSVNVLHSRRTEHPPSVVIPKVFSRSCSCTRLVTYFSSFVLPGQDTAFLNLIIFHALSRSDAHNASKDLTEGKWWLERNSLRLDAHDVLPAICEVVSKPNLISLKSNRKQRAPWDVFHMAPREVEHVWIYGLTEGPVWGFLCLKE